MKSAQRSSWNTGSVSLSYYWDVNLVFLLGIQLIPFCPHFPPLLTRFLNSVPCSSSLFCSQVLWQLKCLCLCRQILTSLAGSFFFFSMQLCCKDIFFGGHFDPCQVTPRHLPSHEVLACQFHLKFGRIWPFSNFQKLHYFEDRITGVTCTADLMGPSQVIVS